MVIVLFSKKYKATNLTRKYLLKIHCFKIKNLAVTINDLLIDNKFHKEKYELLAYRKLINKPFNIFFKLDRELTESQNYHCPMCKDYIFNGEPLHIHRILQKSK